MLKDVFLYHGILIIMEKSKKTFTYYIGVLYIWGRRYIKSRIEGAIAEQNVNARGSFVNQNNRTIEALCSVVQ